MRVRLFLILVWIGCIISWLFPSSVQADTIQAIKTGGWASSATWDKGVPTSSDDVIISNGYVVTINTNATSASLTLGQNNKAGTIQFTNSSFTLTLSSGLILGDGGSTNGKGNISMSGGGTLKIGGSFTAPNPGTFTPGSGTIEYNGTGYQVILSTSILGSSYKNLVISNTGMKTLGGNITVSGSLAITSGTLIIPASLYLIVNGLTRLNSPECLIIKSDSTGTGSFLNNGNISGNGTVTVERYLTPQAWHYISSPVSDARSGIFTNDYLKTSDPASANGWTGYISSTTIPLDVMRGYACWKPSSNPGLTEIFTGSLNTGDLTFTGSRTASDPYAGWHLVGNPYPSAIDLSNGIKWKQFEKTAYFWNQGESGSSYANGNYDIYSVSGFSTHSQYVPATQGFFVHIKSNYTGSTSLTIKNSSRVIDSSTLFLKDSPAIVNGLLMTARSSKNNYSDKITVHFDSTATSGFDDDYDAYKLAGLSDAPQLYTWAGDIMVTCNSLPFSQQEMAIPMGFSCGLPGQYTFTADSINTFESSISIDIEDIKQNKIQDLRLNPVYTFTYDTTDNANRFILHFIKANFGIGTKSSAPEIQIYSYQDAIYIKSDKSQEIPGHIFVYDISGREQFHSSFNDSTLNCFHTGLKPGIYIVNVITQNGTLNKKIVLK
ncbi:MAG: T9SS type A sorting domain-containing protein [Bacteroidota bacterium]|nr:T9SS type A sorting domain-containing protein [Bacteroidota bacterium]